MAEKREKKVHLVSLGCDKNLVDSEKTLGLMYRAGYSFTDEPSEADVIIINTCCFILDAKEESVQKLIEMAELKDRARRHKPLLVVMGCMAERYRQEILEELPEVDVILGANTWQDILEAIGQKLSQQEPVQKYRDISENVFLSKPVRERSVSGSGHYAYLKIAEGCGKNCTYCIIPSLKGSYRSAPMEDLEAEARDLAALGVKELILIAQETTLYGVDLYGKKMLPELLRRLHDIDGLEWIRLMYCYPEEITDELVETMRQLPKVCHYIDMPIQHASDHILRRMARRTTRAEITERIHRIRQMIPDIIIRTTMISGFPGETDADHQKLMEFVRDMEFDRLGDFEFSREEGTRAAGYSHQVSAKNKAARRAEIMQLQQQIAWRKAAERIGTELTVMIEGRLTEEDGDASDGYVYVGRTYMDAPDVDGYIYVEAGHRELMTGDMIRARVTGAHEYDLLGELI